MNKPALEARLLYWRPRTAKGRLLQLVVAGFLLNLMVFPLVGMLLFALTGLPLWEWRAGVMCLAAASMSLVSSPLWVRRIRSARTFYLVEAAVQLPASAFAFATGLALLSIHLTEGALTWLYGGMALGLLFVPMMVERRRRWIRASMERGYLAKSLDRDSGTWDVSNDYEHLHRDPRVMRPPLLWRLAFWIGPAIGMSLSDVLGQANALVVVGLMLSLLGYGAFVAGILPDAAWWLELRRVERELGGRVMLRAEPSHAAHGGR